MVKRLVVCCDGTWNTPDRIDRGQVCPSNVAKIALALAPTDHQGVPQPLYYDKGVGTGMFDRVPGGAFGWGLSRHIQDCYRFIVGCYAPGDELFLFGFSRGAYIARSLAGFIRNAGVLRRDHVRRLPAAYELYRRRDHLSHPAELESELFRRSFSHETRIRFLGVWDTVGSLGIPYARLGFLNRRWQFHDVQLSSYVDHAYHAIAIDEKRAWFRPTLWEQQATAAAQGQVMEQVWFAGVHSNIGGGYQGSGLSDLALTWILEKATACGLAFNEAYVQQHSHPDAFGELRDSKTGLYALLSDAFRPIGKGKQSNETVHASAITRLEQAQQPRYRPPNLLAYLKRGIY
jgi:uncharacterized protein (DUF2235 family)